MAFNRQIPSVPPVNDPVLRNFLSAVRESVNIGFSASVQSAQVALSLTSQSIASALGYIPENTANKSNHTSDSASTTLYPTWWAVSSFVASALSGYALLSAVVNQTLSGFSVSAGDVLASDSIIQALQKLYGNWLNRLSESVTLSNKRIVPRVVQVGSTATPTINTDSCDIFQVINLAVNVSGFVMSGTPVEGDSLIIELTGTSASALTWGSAFEASTVALPTTTVATNKLSVGFLFNAVTGKWRCVWVA